MGKLELKAGDDAVCMVDSGRVVHLPDTGQGLDDILEFLPDAALVVDVAGRIVAWNPAMEKLTGMPAEAMVGKGDFEYAIPYYGYRRPMLLDLVLKPSPVLEKNYPYVKREGETVQTDLFVPALPPSGRHLWVKAAPLRDRSGRLLGAVETTRDITGTRRMERDLLDAKSRLEQEQRGLERKNAALQEVLSQIEAEKARVIERVHSNVARLILPLLRQLNARVGPGDRETCTLIERYLHEISEPFTHRLESRFTSLSPRQLEICKLIRDGLSCKDIAGRFDTSVHTVLNQRQEIRRKLGLNGQNTNLVSYLKSI